MNDWAAKQVWPSLTAINNALKCPKPLAHSGGCHWWYNGSSLFIASRGYSTIVCKSCGFVAKLSSAAPDYPAI